MTRLANLHRNSDLVPGTNFEYIETHAYRDMKRTAVIVGGGRISYGRLCHDVMSFACKLHGHGIRPQHRLAVNSLDSYLHWVILLAAETLGAITCSLHPSEIQDSLKSIVNFADFWVGEQPQISIGKSTPLIVTDEAWSLAGFTAPVDHALFDQIFQPIALDQGQRIRRSSGTTGGMKLMLSERRVEESRMRWYHEYTSITADSRYLVSKSFIISSAYLTANVCLRQGGIVAFDSGEPKMTQIEQLGITHLRLFQDQLLLLLDEIEKTKAPKPSGVTLILGAAPVSQQLWNAALEKIASRIAYAYNANECGAICFMGPGGRGVVRAGVVAQVIDDNDQPLPRGESGRIRVRTPSQIRGYLDNPEMTANNFKDGWFYTGDLGVFRSDRQLDILGRVDDVLNLSGYKHSAPSLEQVALGVDGVKEACATLGHSKLGVDFLALVIVLKPGADQSIVGPKILSRFPSTMVDTIELFFTPQLLKTESGKVRRKAIGEALLLE